MHASLYHKVVTDRLIVNTDYAYIANVETASPEEWIQHAHFGV